MGEGLERKDFGEGPHCRGAPTPDHHGAAQSREAQGKAPRNDLPKNVLQMAEIILLSDFSRYAASASKNDSL